ncbi:cell wall-binding repeat-containing protein [Microbacterium telephonicum]|uniref:cell wall-binding repeat-containing protein n=1 Tax=Microbacterium telephonicum TaxID=1714841 RepID=UPI001F5470F6|nr:cell wall-binding repeat-containing protein [Microbacterium telephonicum]
MANVLTAEVADWQPVATFTYQWKRDGSSIPGATNREYLVTKSDRGAQLTVVSEGRRTGYWPEVRSSTSVQVPTPVTRYGGVDRYQTSAMISAATFVAPVDRVLVATGADFPDALTASAASRGAGPVLLTERDALPVDIEQEIRRLQPREIVVVGSTASISASVADRLEALAPEVRRVGGVDRFQTAAMLSEMAFDPGQALVYVATGANYPDALSAAATAKGPVVLALRDEVPTATMTELKRLRPQRIVIVGDSASISAATLNHIWAHTGSPVDRVSGADRFGTSAAIVRSTGIAPAERVYVASGERFPDAVSGAAAAAAAVAPLLIAQQGALPSNTADLVAQLSPARVSLLGAADAVSETVARRLAELAR